MTFAHIDISPTNRLASLDAGQPMMTGYYCWSRAFSGPIISYGEWQHRRQEADIYFVPLTAINLRGRLTSKIRDIVGNDAKIVVAPDYATAWWGKYYVSPPEVQHELQQADLILCSEPLLWNYATMLVDESKCAFISHPCDTKKIKAMRAKERESVAVAFVHNKETDHFTPWLVGHDLDWALMGLCYEDHDGQKMHIHYNYVSRYNPNHVEHYEWMSTKMAALASGLTTPKMGRLQMEHACLSVPTVGGENIYMQRMLWPTLTTLPCDVKAQRLQLKMLIDNPETYREACDYAYDAVEHWGLEESKKRLLAALEG